MSAKLENEAIGFLTDGTKILEVRSLSGKLRSLVVEVSGPGGLGRKPS